MATTVKVMAGQSLLDIVVQTTGDIGNLMNVAAVNALSITAVLQAGQLITIPDGLTIRPNVVKAIAASTAKPSSEYMEAEQPSLMNDFDANDIDPEDFY